jgi:hypothetical protein
LNTQAHTRFVEPQPDRLTPGAPLTEPQTRWIAAYLKVAAGRRFFAPSLEDIADAASMCRSRACQLGKELEAKGYVVRHIGGARNLELVKLADGTEVKRWFA